MLGQSENPQRLRIEVCEPVMGAPRRLADRVVHGTLGVRAYGSRMPTKIMKLLMTMISFLPCCISTVMRSALGW